MHGSKKPGRYDGGFTYHGVRKAADCFKTKECEGYVNTGQGKTSLCDFRFKTD